MKPRIEFVIEKFVRPYGLRGEWEHWDGPFRNEKFTRKKFDTSYRNPGGERRQDFRIVKVTTEPLPFQESKEKQ